MTVEVRVPSVGESITEGEIAQWFKKVGDAVALDEPVCSLETDKVSVDVPSPASGVLVRLLAKQGDSVAVGAVIAEIDDARTTGAPQPSTAGATSATAAPVAAAPAAPEPKSAAALSPSVRKIVQEHALDVGSIDGTGRGGRITKDDALKRVEAEARPATPPVNAPAPTPASPPSTQGRREERVPMTPLRKRIAERLVAAQQTAAILTTFNEVDMSAIMELRQRFQDKFTEKYGIKVGFMSFFVKACVEALKTYPIVNASVDGETIVYKDYYDIGVAVGGGKGLVVPILRDADRMSFAEVEKNINELGARAKANKLTLEDLQGGTFTISNGGVYGSMLSTPIINPPQSAILGMHNIQKRAVVVGDQIAIRPMMFLALSYDHRIIDGREAVSFLVRVKECLEAPERILLEV
jgi:2-oxoglutarate dehydrogenase E2 component (dihydrolipoamide succinyltransferase)